LKATTFRFRPRYRGVAWTAVGVGGSLAVVSATVGFIALPLATGALGIAAGVAYLASPTWRLAVTIDDDGLEVGAAHRAHGHRRRVRRRGRPRPGALAGGGAAGSGHAHAASSTKYDVHQFEIGIPMPD